jgi:hypothetical protein
MPGNTQRRLSLADNSNNIADFINDQRNHIRRAQQSDNTTTPEKPVLHIQVSESVFSDNVLGSSPGAEATAVIFSVGASLDLSNTAIIGTTKDAQKVEEMPNLIRIEGAAANLKNNCFIGNDDSIAPVIAENAAVYTTSNFNQRISSALPNSGCAFIGHNVMTDSVTLKKGYVCEADDAPVCTSQRPATYRYPCVSYLDEIYFSEWEVSDASISRSYILCPNTDFRVGSRHTDEGTPIGGSYPIILGRSNVRILCGVDGKYENNCQILNGVVQVAHFDEFQTGGSPITDTLVQGIAFSGASSINALIASKGSVVFRDCSFKNNDNVASVYVQTIQPRVRARRKLTSKNVMEIIQSTQERRTQTQSGAISLQATLDSCIFEVSAEEGISAV